jgi:D-beta-D-heptose 7-phosphate kinase/D-beta-D-heptose 1-phosphate adenosyltransferase
MAGLLHRLSIYRPFTALVVGDFMLDQQVYGAAERLSPDAPVPVLHAMRVQDSPGGAAHVSLCLQSLKAGVCCFGVVGSDREGSILRETLESGGCDVNGILIDDSRPTTIKRSLVGLAQHRHPQKMFRVDFESREPLSSDLRERLLAAVESRLREVDVVCVEDYHKGVCSEALCQALIARCRALGKPIFIDPAAIEDYAKYRGATAITPNRSEAELATGMDTPLDPTDLHNAGLARKLLDELALDAVVLTLDRHGALLEESGGEPQVIPTVAREVYDVTGAGDMFLAALAGGRANGFSWPDAVRFANAAAGLEVEVFGAQPIPFARVQREVLATARRFESKLRTLDELLIELAVHRESGHRIVLTNGCFDVIHAGHVAYLREAKKLGQVLVVAINADAQVRRLKGAGRPVYDQAERAEVLSELQSVDYVVVFNEPTAHEIIRAVHPHAYVKGGDYQPSEVNEAALVREMGIEFRLLEHRPGLGSTQVIERFTKAHGGAREPARVAAP